MSVISKDLLQFKVFFGNLKTAFPDKSEHKRHLLALLNLFLIFAVNNTRIPENQLDLINVSLNEFRRK